MPFRRREVDLAAVPLHGGVNHREPEAGSFEAFRREEWLEDALLHIGRHPRAVVLHFDPAAAVRFSRAQRDRPAGAGKRVDRVDDEIDERAHDLTADRRHRSGLAELLLNPREATATHGRHTRFGDPGRLVEDAIEVDELRFRCVRLTAVRAKLFERLDASSDDTLHLRQARPHLVLLAAYQGAIGELNMKREGIEDVLEIVRDTRRHLAERSQFLGTSQDVL
jgi:hypothetical protein